METLAGRSPLSLAKPLGKYGARPSARAYQTLTLLCCWSGPACDAQDSSAEPPAPVSIYDVGTTLPTEGGSVAGFVGNLDMLDGDEIVVSDLPAEGAYILSVSGGEPYDIPITAIDGQAVTGNAFPYAADVTGEGEPDLLVRTQSDDRTRNAIAYLNLSAGEVFGASLLELSDDDSTASSGVCPGYAAVGDIDGDGFGDFVLTAEHERRVFVFLGPLVPNTPVAEFDASPSFEAMQLAPCEVSPPRGATQSADLSGDGIDDVLASSGDDRVAVLDRAALLGEEVGAFAVFRGKLYEAHGLFGSYSDFAGWSIPAPLDTDEDGRIDTLAVGALQGGEYGSFAGAVYLWDFRGGGTTPAVEAEAILGDIRNVGFGAGVASRLAPGGHPELAVGSIGASDDVAHGGEPSLRLFSLSDGDSEETQHLIVPGASTGPDLRMTTGDFEGDGAAEFLFGAPDASVAILVH